MHLRPLLLALALGASCALANAANDPRIPINAVSTPGNAASVFRITQPGSYYLEANLMGADGKQGIRIEASEVRIDLMGFQLQGVPGSLTAIVAPGFYSDIVVHNGTIRGWGGRGVDLVSTTPAQVRDVSVSDLTNGGIYVGNHSLVERCRTRNTGEIGIFTGGSSIVARCTVESATLVGIAVAESSLVKDCTVKNTGAAGIQLGSEATASGCSMSSCQYGISTLSSAVVLDCTIRQAGYTGIQMGSGVARGNTVVDAGVYGIEVGPSTRLVGNAITGSGLDGILAHGGARIEENDIRSHASGAGIRVSGTGNYVVKNTLTGNSIPMVVPNAGNFAGPLVHVNAVNGRSDPWANFHTN